MDDQVKFEQLRDAFAPMMAEEKPKVHNYCSFCGARDDDGIALMITSYEAKICDRCVRICNEILAEKSIPITEVPNV